MINPPSRTFLAQMSEPGLFSPGQGRSAGHLLAHITDQYFITRLAETGFYSVEDLALVAVGGYGRREMFLKSDIDILIIADNLSGDKNQELAKGIFHPLWDAGLEVGHGVRDIRGCLELAEKDLKVLVSILDARFICGNKNFFICFHEASQKLLKRMSRKLSDFLIESALERSAGKGSQNFIEPDIKNDPGGFRDYHLIVWLEKLGFLSGTAPLLGTARKKVLMETMDFFFDLRNVVHSLKNRKNDRLYIDLQPEVSALMGYKGSEKSSGVEIFLGDLFKKQNLISAMAMEVCEKFSMSMHKSGLPDNLDHGNLPLAVIERGGRLFLPCQADLEKNPELAVDIFRIMATSDAYVSWQAMAQIKSLVQKTHLRVIEHHLKNNFTSILLSHKVDQCLRNIRQAGLLKFILPELEKLWFFVQFDGAHTYPLGEHVLHCLNAIASFDENHGFLAEYLGPYKNSLVIRLAALLHDIGKGQPDHAETGAVLARKILQRLGTDEKVSDQVIFLIKNHLVMIDTVLKRDIDEEETVAAFSAKIKGVEGLNLLTFLSYADSLAAGPRIWSPWQENLIRKLYFKARHLMQHTILAGHHAGHRMAMVRDRIRSHELYNQFWEKTIQAMPRRYLLKVPVSDIIKHIKLVEKFEGSEDNNRQPDNFLLLAEQCNEKNGHYFDLTLVTRDRPGLLAAVAATLTMNQVEIYSAGLFTWDNGLVVDLFKVSPPVDPLYTDRTWEEVKKDLKFLLTGKRDVLQFCNALKKALPAGSRFRISVDNDFSDFYTLIEINAPRHPCLTWQISLCLTRLNLDIIYSAISTNADQSMHVFYIRDHNGQKFSGNHKNLIKKIHSAVRTVV
jgi:[protein-PII] uridylyltransferase